MAAYRRHEPWFAGPARDERPGYGYSPDGNLTVRSEDGADIDYTYPSSGADRPHAPTDVDGTSYVWDVNGWLIERSEGGDTETFD